jgi:hypothetical protein
LAPASIRSAAASRTRSRRARYAAVSPPPSGAPHGSGTAGGKAGNDTGAAGNIEHPVARPDGGQRDKILSPWLEDGRDEVTAVVLGDASGELLP